MNTKRLQLRTAVAEILVVDNPGSACVIAQAGKLKRGEFSGRFS